MDASGLWSFVYSINFQIRQIPATNHHFSCEKNLLLSGSIFLKKKIFFRFEISLPQASKYFATKKNTSKLWRAWPLALLVHNFLSYLHFFENCPLKKSFISMQKTWKRGWIRVGKGWKFWCPFSKKGALSDQYQTLP